MSAPRKIWITDDTMAEMRFAGWVWIDEKPSADLYHHDDAVRELVEALEPFAFFDEERTDNTQDAWEIRYRDRFQDWVSYEDIERARAALAKIAQEG